MVIRIVLVLMIMAGWVGEILDIQGAFLHGEFDQGEEIHMEVPQGFEKHYDPMYYVLLLLKTIYGLKQSAFQFWKTILLCFSSMGFVRSKADPCLYFKWSREGLVLWVSWIDDWLVMGPTDSVKAARKQMTDRFNCDVLGNMDEYVGCKLVRNVIEGWLRFTQPVLLLSFEDEFDLPVENDKRNIPAEAGQVMTRAEDGEKVTLEVQSTYRSGVGKLLHMMRWSRPDVLNSIRELSKHMTAATLTHLKAMYRAMTYCMHTKNRGLTLKPNRTWDRSPNHDFVIKGQADASYASCPNTKRSTGGQTTLLEGAPVVMRSKMQKVVALSVTEAELMSGTECAQDMLYTMRIVESMGLKVEKPMILEIDNKGAVDLTNNWSVGGRTRHIDTRYYFLRELKEHNIIKTVWLSGLEMPTDLFTKNLARPLFEKHVTVYRRIFEESV
jgi:hypothetical protein